MTKYCELSFSENFETYLVDGKDDIGVVFNFIFEYAKIVAKDDGLKVFGVIRRFVFFNKVMLNIFILKLRKTIDENSHLLQESMTVLQKRFSELNGQSVKRFE